MELTPEDLRRIKQAAFKLRAPIPAPVVKKKTKKPRKKRTKSGQQKLL